MFTTVMSRTWRVLPSIAPTRVAAPVVRLIIMIWLTVAEGRGLTSHRRGGRVFPVPSCGPQGRLACPWHCSADPDSTPSLTMPMARGRFCVFAARPG
jgi:hypothetical protein